MRLVTSRHAVAFVLAFAGSAGADSPPQPPIRHDYLSTNGEFRLEVDPPERGATRRRSISGERHPKEDDPRLTEEVHRLYDDGARTETRLTYDRERLVSVKIETARVGGEVTFLRLFRSGESRPVWEKEIDYTPGSALVANGGGFVSTFDEWGSVGRTPHVAVLYGPGGRLVRSYALEDLFSAAERRRLTRSVSNVWWAAGRFAGDADVPHSFSPDERYLVLRVQLGGFNPPTQAQPAARERRIETATGKIVR